MLGTVIAPRTVEVDDATLTALTSGKAWVEDSQGYSTSADLVHDGERYVLHLACSLRVRSRVTVRARGAERKSA